MGSDQAVLPGLALAQETYRPADGATPFGEDKGERAPRPRFQKINREQVILRTVDIERLIPDDHPARAIWEFVGKLDLTSYALKIRAVEGMAGRPPLHPQLLISLWVYAYSEGVGSARAIQESCKEDAAYQWLTGMAVVNAHTLSDFRVDNEQSLKGLFVQILAFLSAEELLTLKRVTQDGTKIRASAASNSFRGKERIEKAMKAALEQVEVVNQLPEEESSRRAVKARERAQRERKERLASALDEFAKLQAEGSVKDKKKTRVSKTDPEARVMKQPDGGFAPSYNVQLNTDAAHGVIVAVGVTQAGNDFEQLTAGVDRVEQNLGKLPDQVVTDGGYVSRDNIVEMKLRGVEFIGPQCDEEAKGKSSYEGRGVSPEYHSSFFVYDAATNSFRCPQGKTLHYEGKDESNSQVSHRYRAQMADCQACPAKGQCCPGNQVTGRSVHRTEELPEVAEFRQKMQTEEARDIYRQRSQVAETPNLWIKAKFGLRQFSVRGLKKAGMEALWACVTYNIRLWIRLRWRKEEAVATTTA
jgi:transposase